jgi:hypothetical protein
MVFELASNGFFNQPENKSVSVVTSAMDIQSKVMSHVYRQKAIPTNKVRASINGKNTS